MPCGRDFYDESPERAMQREAKAAQKDAVAAQKIVDFFASNGHSVKTRSTCERGVHNKVHVSKTENELTVKHRGHLIVYDTPDPSTLEKELRTWCETDMKHVRVAPRISQ